MECHLADEYPNIFSQKSNICLEEVSLWINENRLELVPSKIETAILKGKRERKRKMFQMGENGG